MKKAIVFDMDGVIFDTEEIYERAWIKTARKFKMKNFEEFICSFRGATIKDIKKFIDENYSGTVSSDECIKYFKRKCTNKIIMKWLPLKPGVRELLKYLKKNNYTIALATSNSSKVTKLFLNMTRLQHYFDAVVTGNMVEKGKPAPDIYIRACMEIGVNPKECIAIEDSFNGVRSAHNAGMNVIMVPDKIMPTKEIEVLIYGEFKSLIDVKKFLEESVIEVDRSMYGFMGMRPQ